MIGEPSARSVSPASYDEMLRVKKVVLEKMGISPSGMGMHAPKVGAICAMRDADVDWEDIRVKAGWKKNSAMPERYAKKAAKKMIEIDNTLSFYFGLDFWRVGVRALSPPFSFPFYSIEWKGGFAPPFHPIELYILPI